MAFKEIKVSTGVRNDRSPERMDKTDLVNGVNIELDESGKVWRRAGRSAPIHPNDMHSLWSNGDMAFVVSDGVLQHLDVAFGMTPIAPVVGRVAYERVMNTVYWTDGVSSGEFDATGNKQWGITLPTPPVASATIGNLLEGRYLFTITYVRTNDTESGAPMYSAVDVPANGGISFVLPVSSDPTVDRKRLYISEPNGEVPYFYGEFQNSDALATVTQIGQLLYPCRTQRMMPAPAGSLIGYYNGRLYVAENNHLWYSQPYELHLFNRMSNYLGFDAPITTFSPVSDGIYLGTQSEQVFLKGQDPDEFTREFVANYGTIPGTEWEAPGSHVMNGDGITTRVQLWMSKRGACLGLPGGQFKNLTGDHYLPPEGVQYGASLFKVRGGTPQFITSLFN